MDISKKIPTLSPFRISGGRVGGGRRLDFQCGTALTDTADHHIVQK